MYIYVFVFWMLKCIFYFILVLVILNKYNWDIYK